MKMKIKELKNTTSEARLTLDILDIMINSASPVSIEEISKILEVEIKYIFPVIDILLEDEIIEINQDRKYQATTAFRNEFQGQNNEKSYHYYNRI